MEIEAVSFCFGALFGLFFGVIIFILYILLEREQKTKERIMVEELAKRLKNDKQ